MPQSPHKCDPRYVKDRAIKRDADRRGATTKEALNSAASQRVSSATLNTVLFVSLASSLYAAFSSDPRLNVIGTVVGATIFIPTLIAKYNQTSNS